MNQVECFQRERLRTESGKRRVEGGIQATRQTGSRASVEEQHAQNMSNVMRGLRGLDHTISDVQHTPKHKLPVGMARSVIRHKSGGNKLRTVVRTSFNTDGGDHHRKIETGPDKE